MNFYKLLAGLYETTGKAIVVTMVMLSELASKMDVFLVFNVMSYPVCEQVLVLMAFSCHSITYD